MVLMISTPKRIQISIQMGILRTRVLRLNMKDSEKPKEKMRNQEDFVENMEGLKEKKEGVTIAMEIPASISGMHWAV